MTRRGFFGLLAALPFVKRFVPAPYCPLPDIYPAAIKDEFFVSTPILAYFRDNMKIASTDTYFLTKQGIFRVDGSDESEDF